MLYQTIAHERPAERGLRRQHHHRRPAGNTAISASAPLIELDGELIAFSSQGLSAARRRQRAQSPAGAENAVRGDDMVPAAVPEKPLTIR
ncbi:hypothetical protein LN650_13875 [Klebsiella pneumoniae subsp. pneumoniae]|nr:hypothetical protein [Klebsiella pneumoniae subsp. pneumoniae]